MTKVLLSLIVALFANISISAQNYNAVFPIVNTYTNDYPEYITANISMSYEYMGTNVYVADRMHLWCGGVMYLSELKGKYISFKYVTKKEGNSGGDWNTGGCSVQMAFHPGGYYDATWRFSVIADDCPLYAFRLKDNGLFIVNLRNFSEIAQIDSSTDPKSYSGLTVFAGQKTTDKDMIVVAGQNLFKVFETIPVSSGVRQILSSDKKPTYFGINGQKYDDPQPGLNIVVDGDKTKKIVVK